MNEIGLELALIAVLVLVNGVLSGSELAIVSARKHRLQQRAEEGDSGARRALELAAEPNKFLSTVQIGITLVGILAGAFGGATVAEQLALRFEDAGLGKGTADALGVAVVVLAITYLSLVVGELVPKRMALAYPERIASFMAAPLCVLGKAGAPIVGLLSASTDLVLWLFRVKPASATSVTEEELRMLLLESTQQGVIELGEQELATAALQLGDRQVSDVMTPRLEVTWLDATDPPDEVWSTIAGSHHHWFPVIEHDADQVLGVVAVRDLFRAAVNGGARDLRPVLKPVEFLPVTLSLLTALERMRQDEVPLAVVVDEYGGTNGIITMTDILGAIVGAFASDFQDAPDIVVRDDGSWLADGRVLLERLGEVLAIRELGENGDYQTLAGFALHHLGRIPAVGDAFEAEGFRFEVVDMDARRIDRVLVSRL